MNVVELDKFYQLNSANLHSWMENGTKLLTNLLGACSLAIALGIFGKFVWGFLYKVHHRTFQSRPTTALLSSIVKVPILIAGILLALDGVDLNGTVIVVLAGAGIASLTIGFAKEDFTENLFADIAMGTRNADILIPFPTFTAEFAAERGEKRDSMLNSVNVESRKQTREKAMK